MGVFHSCCPLKSLTRWYLFTSIRFIRLNQITRMKRARICTLQNPFHSSIAPIYLLHNAYLRRTDYAIYSTPTKSGDDDERRDDRQLNQLSGVNEGENTNVCSFFSNPSTFAVFTSHMNTVPSAEPTETQLASTLNTALDQSQPTLKPSALCTMNRKKSAISDCGGILREMDRV